MLQYRVQATGYNGKIVAIAHTHKATGMAARISENEFLRRAIARFGNRFDYTGIHYRSYKSPLKIRCRRHPVQLITISPEKHLRTTGGCKHCLRERRIAALERELNRDPATRPTGSEHSDAQLGDDLVWACQSTDP